MKKQKLIMEQLDRKIVKYRGLEKIVIPPTGWIYSIRQALNMSLKQLGNRLSITPQSVCGCLLNSSQLILNSQFNG